MTTMPNKLKMYMVSLVNDPDGLFGTELVWDYNKTGAVQQGIKEFGIENVFHAVDNIKVRLRTGGHREYNAPDGPGPVLRTQKKEQRVWRNQDTWDHGSR